MLPRGSGIPKCRSVGQGARTGRYFPTISDEVTTLPDRPAVTRRNATLTLVAMTLANSMILVDQTAVPLAIPRIVGDLDGSVGTSQWILTANVLALAGFMVFGGRLGDLLGLRRVFLVSSLVFIIPSTL